MVLVGVITCINLWIMHLCGNIPWLWVLWTLTGSEDLEYGLKVHIYTTCFIVLEFWIDDLPREHESIFTDEIIFWVAFSFHLFTHCIFHSIIKSKCQRCRIWNLKVFSFHIKTSTHSILTRKPLQRERNY